MGFEDRPLLSPTSYPDGHRPVDEETRRTAIANESNKFRSAFIAALIVCSIYMGIGVALLVVYLLVPTNPWIHAGLITGAGELMGGPVVILISIVIVYSIQKCRRRHQSAAERLKSTEGIAYEWTYAENHEYKHYLQFKYCWNANFFKKLMPAILSMVIPGTVLWALLVVLTCVVNENPDIGAIIIGQFFRFALPMYGIAIGIFLGVVIHNYYRQNEPFKAWKHTCILYSNGLIYYDGDAYLLQSEFSPLTDEIWNLTKAKLTTQDFRGEQFIVMQLDLTAKGGKTRAVKTVEILIPSSLRSSAEDMMRKVASPFTSNIIAEINQNVQTC